MPAAPPPGDPAPSSGTLPAAALAGAGQRAVRRVRARAVLRDPVRLLRLQHLHRRRARRPGCPGTPTPGWPSPRSGWPAGCSATRRPRSAPCSSAAARRPCCPPAELGAILAAVRRRVRAGARRRGDRRGEPGDRRPRRALAALRAAGFTRISFGMQSAAPHVLAVLDRAHQPGRPEQCVGVGPRGRVRARQPGPDLRHAGGDRRRLGAGRWPPRWRPARPHLGVRADRRGGHPAGRPGPPRRDRGAGRRRDGRPLPGRGRAARRGAGLDWYEISNWAAGPAAQCRHNLLYWHGADWWGIGPGAHSHVGGTRWWNVRHPAAYAARLAAGDSPAQAREVLTAAERGPSGSC